MREHLYQGKDTDSGKWVQGDLVTNGIDYETAIRINDKTLSEYGQIVKVDPDTVSEFAGLTDKNGKRIFEGHIVKWIANGITHIDEVSFVHGKFNAGDFPLFMVTLCNAEVIGNKWDNHELLEDGAE